MGRTQAVFLIAIVLAGCSQRPHITVGSKNFTEQIVLGEILAQQIERKLGIGVVRKFNLGGTLLTHEALKSGSIDLYPEYTGTALTAVLKLPPSTDPARVRAQVAEEYAKRWNLIWLPPFGFENTFAMVVRKTDAPSDGLLSTAASARSWRLGAGYEFIMRADGLPGLLKTYPLRIDGNPVTMDLGLLYSALQSNKVDMAAANSTDGLLSILPLTALKDDRRYFPPYECAVIASQQILDKEPRLRAALEELSGKIDSATMRKLNHALDGKRKSVREIVAEFLKSGEISSFAEQ